MCPEACFYNPFKFEKNCEAWEDDQCSDDVCDARAKAGECETDDTGYMQAMCHKSCEDCKNEPKADEKDC